LNCTQRSSLGEFRCGARLRRLREVRSGASWHFAKDAPNDDLVGGKCGQNAHLSKCEARYFFWQLVGKLHAVKLMHHFQAPSRRPQEAVCR